VLGIEVSSESSSLFMRKLEYLSLQGKLIKTWKYVTNLIFTKHYRLEHPPFKAGIPGLSFLPSEVRCAVGRWRGADSVRRASIDTKIYTIFQGFKKGLLPVRLDAVSMQLRGHAASLTKDGIYRNRRVVSGDVEDELFPDGYQPSAVAGRAYLEHIGRKAIVALGLGNVCQADIEVTSVSSKASVESNFASNGSVGFAFTRWVRSQFADSCSMEPYQQYAHVSLCQSSTLVGFVEDRTRFTAPREVRTYVVSDHDLAMFGHDYSRETSLAIPACILEPMKVRVITKPRALQYAPLQVLQNRLWRKLAEHPSKIFLYTGETVTDDSIREFALSCQWRSGSRFVSGDYSAATDNLKGSVSSTLAELLFGGLKKQHPELYNRIQKSLTGGEIRYDGVMPPAADWVCETDRLYTEATHKRGDAFRCAWRRQLPDNIRQRNGQLMGNVLSFPLLCLANLCCYWMAVERYQMRDVNFDELPPVRINGDDILFLTPDESFYDIWKREAADFGFELSQGKNLVSERVLQINSALYRTCIRNADDPAAIGTADACYLADVRNVPFVNLGLITNRKKNDCSVDYSLERTGLDTRDHTVPSWVHRVSNAPKIVAELVRGHSKLRDKAVSLYEDHNRWLRERLHKLPWGPMCDLARDERQEGWLLYLQRYFRKIVPSDPNGQLRQDMPTSSLLRRLTTCFEDDDCFDAYRATRIRAIFPRGPEIEEKLDEWTTLSLRGQKWKDQTNKDEREMCSDFDAWSLFCDFAAESGIDYPEFGCSVALY
jgi:hypothetical protein